MEQTDVRVAPLSADGTSRPETVLRATGVLDPARQLRLGKADLDDALAAGVRTAALDIGSALVVGVSPAGVVRYFNPAAERLTGYTAAEVVGRSIWELFVPEDEAAGVQAIFRRLGVAEFPVRHRNAWLMRDGSRRHIAWTNTVLTDTAGTVVAVVGTGIDITPEVEATGLLVSVLNATTEQAVIATAADGYITIFNVGAERMFGYPAEQMVGRCTPELFYDPGEVASRLAATAAGSRLAALVGSAVHGDADNAEWTLRRADGTTLRAAVSVTPLSRGQGEPSGYLFIAVDTTDRARAEAALRQEADVYAWRALHDELTQLPNRSLLRDRLEHAIATAARHDKCVGLIFLDLDHFKDVNDTYGHVAGDQLLVGIADRLAASARSSDTVARYGGDEFVVLCEDLNDPLELDAIAARVGSAVQQETRVDGAVLVPSASLGTVAAPGSDTTPEKLLAAADRAMYRSRGLR